MKLYTAPRMFDAAVQPGGAGYRDPLTRIDWTQLGAHERWLPDAALSLYGLPQFAAHRRFRGIQRRE